jgi:cyclin-dependent kinase 12/13
MSSNNNNTTTTITTWSDLPKSSWYTPLASTYREIRQVGEGTYGKVYEGVQRLVATSNNTDNKNVALKKIKISSEKNPYRGLPQNALREIKLLKSKCQHVNIVKLLDVSVSVVPQSESLQNGDELMDIETTEGANSSSGFIYLVFEYVEHDLSGIINSKYVFSSEAIACLTKQLLSGLAYLHDQNICHRDLKTSNLLIGRNYHLKLADFGLARELNREDPTVTYTNKVITLWYRPPELLLGAVHYTCVIDVWSVGCILLELIRGASIFPGEDEIDQLKKIFDITGLPTSSNWPGYNELPKSRMLEKFSMSIGSSTISSYCESRGLDRDVVALVSRLLELDPTRRCTAKQALATRYCSNAVDFTQLPPMNLPQGVTLHEWESKAEKRRLKQQQQQQEAEKHAAVSSAMVGGSSNNNVNIGNHGYKTSSSSNNNNPTNSGESNSNSNNHNNNNTKRHVQPPITASHIFDSNEEDNQLDSGREIGMEKSHRHRGGGSSSASGVNNNDNNRSTSLTGSRGGVGSFDTSFNNRSSSSNVFHERQQDQQQPRQLSHPPPDLATSTTTTTTQSSSNRNTATTDTNDYVRRRSSTATSSSSNNNNTTTTIKIDQKHSNPFGPQNNSRTIFVDNLPGDVTEQEVGLFFQDCGGIQTVRILSGRGKLCAGYILFNNAVGANNSQKHHGEYMNPGSNYRPLIIDRLDENNTTTATTSNRHYQDEEEQHQSHHQRFDKTTTTTSSSSSANIMPSFDRMIERRDFPQEEKEDRRRLGDHRTISGKRDSRYDDNDDDRDYRDRDRGRDHHHPQVQHRHDHHHRRRSRSRSRSPPPHHRSHSRSHNDNRYDERNDNDRNNNNTRTKFNNDRPRYEHHHHQQRSGRDSGSIVQLGGDGGNSGRQRSTDHDDFNNKSSGNKSGHHQHRQNKQSHQQQTPQPTMTNKNTESTSHNTAKTTTTTTNSSSSTTTSGGIRRPPAAGVTIGPTSQ